MDVYLCIKYTKIFTNDRLLQINMLQHLLSVRLLHRCSQFVQVNNQSSFPLESSTNWKLSVNGKVKINFSYLYFIVFTIIKLASIQNWCFIVCLKRIGHA